MRTVAAPLPPLAAAVRPGGVVPILAILAVLLVLRRRPAARLPRARRR